MSTPNPLEGTGAVANGPVSRKQHVIAGLKTVVYGLEELPKGQRYVACLWLLHPRLSEQSKMAPIADTVISRWNKRLKARNALSPAVPGLIAVSLDQRNHGSREIDPVANEAWRGGNPRHAQDMFSIYQGTAADTSQLISYLGAYLFPNEEHKLVKHMTLGVSLGGHASWLCLLHDSRVTCGVVVIGCPDYLMLMKHRARLSKLKTWTESSPPGSTFVGSADFPKDLAAAVEAYDPAGVFLGPVSQRTEESYTRRPTEPDLKRVSSLMTQKLKGKSILTLSGGDDKLVPYSQSRPFIRWLQSAINKDGWCSHSNITLRDHVFQGVGHAMTPSMLETATDFLIESLEQMEDSNSSPRSKM